MVAALVEIEDEFDISLPDDFFGGPGIGSLNGLSATVESMMAE